MASALVRQLQRCLRPSPAYRCLCVLHTVLAVRQKACVTAPIDKRSDSVCYYDYYGLIREGSSCPRQCVYGRPVSAHTPRVQLSVYDFSASWRSELG